MAEIRSDYLAEMQAAARRAVSNNNVRRKWGDSKHGSPVGVLVLIGEIVRLNRALAEIVTATDTKFTDEQAADRASELARKAMTPGAEVLLAVPDEPLPTAQQKDGQ